MLLEDKLRDPQAAFWKCLSSPEPFCDDEQKETCRKMVDALPDDLVVHAANTSYAYWYLSNLPETTLSEENKISMAMREARRHLVYMDGDYEKALANLIESLEYRKVSGRVHGPIIQRKFNMITSILLIIPNHPLHVNKRTGKETSFVENLFWKSV